MHCVEVLVSVITGLITGVVSGTIVTVYFRRRDKKHEEERRLLQIFDTWYDHIVKYVDRIVPMEDCDMKFLRDTWDIAEYDDKLMNKLLCSFGKLKDITNDNNCRKQISTEEQAVIDEAYEALNELNKLISSKPKKKKCNPK